MPRLVPALRAMLTAASLLASGALQGLAACGIEGGSATAAGFTRLTEHGDLMLSDGSLGRLSGIRLLQPEPGGPDPQATRLDDIIRPWREQGRVMMSGDPGAASAPKPDRWGRIPVQLVLGDGSLDGVLAYGLVRTGFAMAWAPELPPECRMSFLRAEDAARRARSGRWTEIHNRALDAADGANVAARAGRVVVMSGRINHVGQTRRATYLNFGARGTGASAEVGLSIWRLLEGQGWTRERLKGKMVRVRGVVMEGRPARLLLGDVSAIEFLN
jgi:hypothetical protein